MNTILTDLEAAIAAEQTETSHLKVARSLFSQLVVRLDAHRITAKRIEEEQAAAKAAEIEAAAKLVQQAEQEKADAAAKLEQSQETIAIPPQS
jgi:uncharacterized protein YdaU (DUF1376 family)